MQAQAEPEVGHWQEGEEVRSEEYVICGERKQRRVSTESNPFSLAESSYVHSAPPAMGLCNTFTGLHFPVH